MHYLDMSSLELVAFENENWHRRLIREDMTQKTYYTGQAAYSVRAVMAAADKEKN